MYDEPFVEPVWNLSMTLIRTYKAIYVLKIRELTSNLPEWTSHKNFFVQCSPISERSLLCLKVPRFLLLYFWQNSINVSMEHCWNDTDRGKPKYCKKHRPQRRQNHHKFSLGLARDGITFSAVRDQSDDKACNHRSKLHYKDSFWKFQLE